MIDDLVERLRDWPYQGETMALQAADEITRLRARVAELTEDRVKSVLPLGPQIDTAVARAEAAEARVTELTAQLAAAREDALDAAAAAVRQALVDASFNYRNNKVLSSAMFKAELHATNAIRTLANEAKP
jgi:16S rRNA G527 N7-methylase RsmG